MNVDEKLKLAVWAKAQFAAGGHHEGDWREDACGALMRFADYGNREAEYGWEIDHITPAAKGGTDDIDNLQPLHWKNNEGKGDGPMKCTVALRSGGNLPCARNLGHTVEVERATEAFAKQCAKDGCVFEKPSSASALYELDGERYVRLAQEEPDSSTLAVYYVARNGSLTYLLNDFFAPKAFKACWVGALPALLVQRGY